VTEVGEGCLFMVGSHVGHDCRIGNNVSFANNVVLGGHVRVGDFTFLGGHVAIHQYVRIGEGVMMAGMSAARDDIIPFGFALGQTGALVGLNVVGLKRRGATRAQLHALRRAYRALFFGDGRLADRVELLLRVSFRSPGAMCDLSRKFGCDPEDALEIARLAAELGITVRGLSFHVGSQAADSAKHVEAILACTKLMAAGRKAKLGPLDTLDIGGGFPIDYAQPVEDIGRFCEPLREALAKLPRKVRVIAEPGRYIVGPSVIGVASVMGRARREGHWWYYLDDGLYGSYSGQLYDHARYPVEPLRDGEERLPSVLAGPTCDSIDVIAENLMLPQLDAGDLIVGRAMGAYTWASASEFNFFPKATVVAVNGTPGDTGTVMPFPL